MHVVWSATHRPESAPSALQRKGVAGGQLTLLGHLVMSARHWPPAVHLLVPAGQPFA